ncbi:MULTISPECIES: hemerythrin domain-containing protein [unclassified Streptomyces]|uniref:hemerythrin domain-containing protein n=1 Tax=unclassified Streptomyces TaxID=2593676 RepID=UPI002E310ADA|nr:hemerythrin domain-containing protein [Streptomyces sp. NBC_01268]
MPLRPEPSDRLTAFGNQLVDVHLYLREELARLRADVAAHLTSGGERPRELRAHCLAFCSALTRHHTAEDEGVFPTLARRHPELRPVLDELSRDHEQVTELLRAVRKLVDGLGAGPEPDPAEVRRISGELDGLVALVESHFTYEERKLVAALNALDGSEGARDAGFEDFALRDLTQP